MCIRFIFFLMIRRPPRSTQSRSSAASDVYKRQVPIDGRTGMSVLQDNHNITNRTDIPVRPHRWTDRNVRPTRPVSYTHLRAHETRHDLVCRLLLEKKKKKNKQTINKT